MIRFMLDTNIVSMVMRRHPAVLSRLARENAASIAVSSLTCAELLYGLAKRRQGVRLAVAIHDFLDRTEVAAWDRIAAKAYAALRVENEARGLSLSPLDMIIAAHANALDATLITNDAAFARLPGLAVEDWSRAS